MIENPWSFIFLGACIGMILGAIIGLGLGWASGRRETLAEVYERINPSDNSYPETSMADAHLLCHEIEQELGLKYLQRFESKK